MRQLKDFDCTNLDLEHHSSAIIWRYGIVPMYLVIACIVYRIPDGPTCVGLIGTIIVETASFPHEASLNKHFQRLRRSEEERALCGLDAALAPLRWQTAEVPTNVSCPSLREVC